MGAQVRNNDVTLARLFFACGFIFIAKGFGGANAAGLGSGTVIGNQAIGTGTGIANAGPGNNYIDVQWRQLFTEENL